MNFLSKVEIMPKVAQLAAGTRELSACYIYTLTAELAAGTWELSACYTGGYTLTA